MKKKYLIYGAIGLTICFGLSSLKNKNQTHKVSGFKHSKLENDSFTALNTQNKNHREVEKKVNKVLKKVKSTTFTAHFKKIKPSISLEQSIQELTPIAQNDSTTPTPPPTSQQKNKNAKKENDPKKTDLAKEEKEEAEKENRKDEEELVASNTDEESNEFKFEESDLVESHKPSITVSGNLIRKDNSNINKIKDNNNEESIEKEEINSNEPNNGQTTTSVRENENSSSNISNITSELNTKLLNGDLEAFSDLALQSKELQSEAGYRYFESLLFQHTNNRETYLTVESTMDHLFSQPSTASLHVERILDEKQNPYKKQSAEFLYEIVQNWPIANKDQFENIFIDGFTMKYKAAPEAEDFESDIIDLVNLIYEKDGQFSSSASLSSLDPQ